MSEIPPFAKVLMQRSSADNSPQKRSQLSQSMKAKSSNYSKTFSYQLSTSKSEEIRELKAENDHLRETIDTQNENFASLQKSFVNLQQQLNEEREASQEFIKLVTNLRNSLTIEQEKSGSLQEQLNQLDTFLKTRQIVNSQRKQMQERLQKEYENLLNDYNHSIDTISSQSKEIRDLRSRIQDLEDELEATIKRAANPSPSRERNTYNDYKKENTPTKDNNEFFNQFDDYEAGKEQFLRQSLPSKPPPLSIPDQFNEPSTPRRDEFSYTYNNNNNNFNNNYNNNNKFSKTAPSPKHRNTDQPLRLQSVTVGDYSPLRTPQKSAAPFAVGDSTEFENPRKRETFYNSPPRSPPKPTPHALNDSIKFGDDGDKDTMKTMQEEQEERQQNYLDYEQNVEEMKKELTQLCAQKDFIESMINAAPTRTSTLVQTKREKRQWEEKFEVIMKQISSLRLKLKRMREL